jgi:hypothetical protein
VRHRHLDTTEWTLAAIDSAIEYGDLADWQELFRAAKRDRSLAERVLRVATARPQDGGAALAAALARRVLEGAGGR